MRGVAWIVLLVVAGCTGSNGSPAGGAEANAGSSGGRDLAASTEVQVGPTGVRLGFHVTNATESPLELTFPSSQRYDFVVKRPSGDVVWSWSATRSFLQVVSQATLAPGESWDMEAVWDPGAVSGPLVATGMLVARDRPVEQSTTFELP